MAREARTGSLAAELPVSLVEPDGLIVTTDGRYVRLIQCDRVPNTITASQDFSRADLVVESLAGLTPQGLASKLGFTVFACASESSPAEETRPA